MSKLATIALGAAIALSPALVRAQSDPSGAQNPNSPATGANTTGASNMGATTNGQKGNGSAYDNPGSDTPGSANRTMPNTAAGWLGMLFSGSMLSGAGVALRRFKK